MSNNPVILVSPGELALLIEQAVSKALADRQPETPHTDGKEPLIDRTELCSRLDVTEQTVIRYEKKGKIPSFRVGDACRYDWEAVKKALLKKS